MPAQPTYVVLDVETTGLKAENDEIIEIGAQKCQGREVLGEFEQLLKASRPLSAETIAVNGITQEMVDSEGKDQAEVLRAFREFVGDHIIVAHNAPFDVGFLNASFQRHGIPIFTNRTIDTIEIAKKYLILASYRLSNVAAYLKVEQPSAHRSMIDVITTREVFLKLIERAKGK
jgi:DNA polymerase-3 subunit alpha (Gram-positive type)